MAIGFDAITAGHIGGNPVTSLSFASGVTGTLINGMAYVVILSTSSGAISVTWGGISMTQVTDVTTTGGDAIRVTVFGLIAPPTGSQTVNITTPNSNGLGAYAITYSGVKQAYTADNVGVGGQASGQGNVSQGITTVADNCWAFLLVQSNAAYSGSTGDVLRSKGNGATSTRISSLSDSNTPITPAGSYTMNMTRDGGGSGISDIMWMSFVPAASSVLPSVSDSVTVSENVQIIVKAVPSVSDSVAVTENVQMSVLESVSVSDAVVISENVQMVITSSFSVSDSVAVTENVQMAQILVVSVNEIVSVSEQIAVLSIEGPVVLDAVLISENVQVVITSFISVSDTVTVTESAIPMVMDTFSVFETVTVSENLNVVLTNNIVANDAVAVSENVQLVLITAVSVFDVVSVTEDVNIEVRERASISDTVTVTENVTITIFDSIPVFDTITVSENLQVVMADSPSLFDTVTVSESLTVVVNEQVRGVFDTVTVTEHVQLGIVRRVSAGSWILQTGFKQSSYILKVNDV